MIFQELTAEQVLSDIEEHISDSLGYVHESEFTATKIYLVGSRVKNTHREDSDLDVAVQYKGNLNEDDIFNSLNRDSLIIEGLTIDFIPYNELEGNEIINLNEAVLLLEEEPNDSLTINLSNEEDFKSILKKPNGLYSGKNVEGEEVIVFLDSDTGLTVKTYQQNGWVQVSEYDKDGIKTDDYIEGRHSNN